MAGRTGVLDGVVGLAVGFVVALGVPNMGITTGVAGLLGGRGGKTTLGVLVILASEDRSLLLLEGVVLGEGKVWWPAAGESGSNFVRSERVWVVFICLNKLGTIILCFPSVLEGGVEARSVLSAPGV